MKSYKIKSALSAFFFLMSMPLFAWSNDRLLMEISSENLYNGGIKVLFILSEVHSPKMYHYKGASSPKVVCDFFNVKIKPGLKKDIRVNTDYIKNVRMGEHHHPNEKVRVVLDLVPGNDYTVDEIPPEPNVFAVIIRSDNIKPSQSSSKIVENYISETTQPTHTTVVQTTQRPTTTLTPPVEQPIDEPYTPDEENDENVADEDYDTDFSENEEWIERLVESNAGEQAPKKWPLKKTFGQLKMIVHLDTDPNGFISLKGYIINMSDEFYYRVQLSFDVFNSNADVIEQSYADFYNVEPGDRRKMNVHVAYKTASNFRLMERLFW